jgi:UDP-glucose 4-epimerase
MYGTTKTYIPNRPGEAQTTLADFSKATKILEYNPTRNLKDYIENQILATIPSI